MNKTVVQIREINKIEKELASAYAGVLAMHSPDNEIVQIPCTFLYYHKNIYAALRTDDDLIEKITYDNDVSFTVTRSESIKSKKKHENHYITRIVSVTLSGFLKRPEEVKTSEVVIDLYCIKYSGKKDDVENPDKSFFLMLDTSEMRAFEEVIE